MSIYSMLVGIEEHGYTDEVDLKEIIQRLGGRKDVVDRILDRYENDQAVMTQTILSYALILISLKMEDEG